MEAGDIVAMLDASMLLAALCGFFGAMVYMFCRGCAVAIVEAVEGTQWHQDWQDKLYVRWLNAQTVKQVKAARQTGRVSLGVLLAGVFVLVVVLASCAAPAPPLTGSDVWWDNVKRGW